MSKLYVLAEDSRVVEPLCQGLIGLGHTCLVASDAAGLVSGEGGMELVMLEAASYARAGELSRRIKRERNLPVIALLHDVPADAGAFFDTVDDFAIEPWNEKELNLRIKRLLRRTSGAAAGEIVGCGDLVIDVAAYEVFVAGRPVELTFKEYELLKFLASNPDRVLSRETLLNRVWGYDYYGGDRTVDVHIQRLRTKIEQSKNVVIETVRNIGYRLKSNAC